MTSYPPIKLTLSIKALFFAISLLLTPQAFAFDKINASFFGNLAIEGYDPVAYFTQNKAVSSINKKWRADRDQYIIDADRYWPQLLEK